MKRRFILFLHQLSSYRKSQILTQCKSINSFGNLPAKTLFILLMLGLPLLSCNNEQSRQASKKNQDIGLDEILFFLGNQFAEKVDSNYHAIVNFTVTDRNRAYHLTIHDKQIQLGDSVNSEANFTFKSSLAHYKKIYLGEITGLTSMGRAEMSDQTPLDFDFHKPLTNNPMNDLLFFVQRFFNPSPNDKVLLSKENSRIVHGAHAIPLFYQTTDEMGVRSAWYQINKGQQVNEPGDTNPFPQYFIITKGTGFARIGKDTLQVGENEGYYIAPGEDHVFWTETDEPMEMIFLAWGEGA